MIKHGRTLEEGDAPRCAFGARMSRTCANAVPPQVSRLAATCVPGATAYSWRINECSVMKYCARRDVAPQLPNTAFSWFPTAPGLRRWRGVFSTHSRLRPRRKPQTPDLPKLVLDPRPARHGQRPAGTEEETAADADRARATRWNPTKWTRTGHGQS
eukprot:gene7901-biopygen7587